MHLDQALDALHNGEIQWHELKCLPAYFHQLPPAGKKTFEVRRDDRGFQTGDVLHIKEWVKSESSHMWKFTGNSAHFRIEYILAGGQLGLEPGYVAMAITPLETG